MYLRCKTLNWQCINAFIKTGSTPLIYPKISDLSNFYTSPLGSKARDTIWRTLIRLWPHAPNERLLGIGFPFPYLKSYQPEAERCFSFTLSKHGALHWPEDYPNATALVDPLFLPLEDQSIDRILVIHALELIDNPHSFLEELWRILAPGGKILFVVPNRKGLWARFDKTPFGSGQPFSKTQLKDLFYETDFSPVNWVETLFMPPFKSTKLIHFSAFWENLGGGLCLPFGGLHVIEVTKHLYRPVQVLAAQTVKRPKFFIPIARPIPLE